jgi:hypothetical protein
MPSYLKLKAFMFLARARARKTRSSNYGREHKGIFGARGMVGSIKAFGCTNFDVEPWIGGPKTFLLSTFQGLTPITKVWRAKVLSTPSMSSKPNSFWLSTIIFHSWLEFQCKKVQKLVKSQRNFLSSSNVQH